MIMRIGTKVKERRRLEYLKRKQCSKEYFDTPSSPLWEETLVFNNDNGDVSKTIKVKE